MVIHNMMFEVKNLSFSYDAEKILKDITFKLDKKEFLVIVGKSGSGKTTLLRTIAGLEKISQGSIMMHDEEITYKDIKSRDLGYIMQEYPLYPNLSVFENIAFGLKNKRLKLDDVEDKVYEISKLLGVYKLLNEKPKYLSGGEKQRVCLAKTLISKPKIVLFDEPLSNLDTQQKQEVRKEIYTLYETLDIPFIYVTHDQEEALSLATKILYLDDGKIIQFDDKEEFILNPKNLSVAEFFTIPQLNLLNGQIDHKNFKLIIDEKVSIQMNTLQYDLFKNRNDVLIGIKPEHIYIEDNGLMNGLIVNLESHGSKFLYEVQQDNENTLYIKSSKEFRLNERISFSLSRDDLFFFDTNDHNSISLYHYLNRYHVTIKDKNFYLDNIKLMMDQKYLSSLYITDMNNLYLNIPNDAISIHPHDGFICIPICYMETTYYQGKHYHKVLILDTDFHLYFSTQQFIDASNFNNVYINKDKLIVTNNNGATLNTKYEITNNQAIVLLKNYNTHSKIKVGKKILKFDKVNLPNGKYLVELSPFISIIEKCENPKNLKKVYRKHMNSNVLIASSYDEDFIDNNHIIYVKIEGFDNYLTLITHEKFSVFNQPELVISVPLSSLKFIRQVL